MTDTRPRSVLFAPANKLELLQKFPRFAPDIAVADLEDAVPDTPEAKAEARATMRRALAWLADNAPEQTVYVRINPVHSPHFAADIAALPSGVAGVVLPKVERAADLLALTEALAARAVVAQGRQDVAVMVGLETVAGTERVADILAEGGAASVYFGAEDYVADLGGQRRADALEVLYPRSKVAAQARLAGIPAFDIVCTALRDDAAFRREAELGRALGYAGKLCIHPAQVALAHEVFSPSEEELRRARALLDAYAAAEAAGGGVIAFEGQMVDAPMLLQARAVLERAGEE